VNKNLDGINAGLLALDCLFISFPIGKASELVWEEEVGSIGAVIDKQIIHHFIFELGPFNMSELDDTVDFCQREGVSFAQGSSFALRNLARSFFTRGKSVGCSQFVCSQIAGSRQWSMKRHLHKLMTNQFFPGLTNGGSQIDWPSGHRHSGGCLPFPPHFGSPLPASPRSGWAPGDPDPGSFLCHNL